MAVKISGLFFSLLILSLTAVSQQKPSPEAEAFFTKAMSQINSKHVRWIKSTAKETNDKNLTPDDITNRVNTYATPGTMGDGDIMAMCFLVMMQAAKSAQEDLKAIMARVKSINEQKSKMRETLAKLNEKNTAISRVQLDSFKLLLTKQRTVATVQPERTKPVTRTEIDDLKNKMNDEQDSLSEQGEQQQLKMQLIMDRMTKADSAASNIMKKISETTGSIIQNLK